MSEGEQPPTYPYRVVASYHEPSYEFEIVTYCRALDEEQARIYLVHMLVKAFGLWSAMDHIRAELQPEGQPEPGEQEAAAPAGDVDLPRTGHKQIPAGKAGVGAQLRPSAGAIG